MNHLGSRSSILLPPPPNGLVYTISLKFGWMDFMDWHWPNKVLLLIIFFRLGSNVKVTRSYVSKCCYNSCVHNFSRLVEWILINLTCKILRLNFRGQQCKGQGHNGLTICNRYSVLYTPSFWYRVRGWQVDIKQHTKFFNLMITIYRYFCYVTYYKQRQWHYSLQKTTNWGLHVLKSYFIVNTLQVSFRNMLMFSTVLLD